jgi:plasmid stability protein
MATIQIRDIPEDAYEVIRRRARADGKSIQAYMRDQVVEQARRRSKADVMAELEAALARDPGPGVNTEDVLADLDEARR